MALKGQAISIRKDQGMADLNCECGACGFDLNFTKPQLSLFCGCKDCRQALEWGATKGGKNPSALPELIYMKKRLIIFILTPLFLFSQEWNERASSGVGLVGISLGLLIVFVDVLKELPATMILRPFDLSTLAIKAHELAIDERLHDASIPLLTIIFLCLIPLYFLTKVIRQE